MTAVDRAARWARSLRGRWTLAVVAVCVVEAALVALAVRASTVQAFEEFVVQESLDGMLEHVEAHVRETGSIQGFVPPRQRLRLAQREALGDDRPPAGRPVRGRPPAAPPADAAPFQARQSPLPPPLAQGRPIRFGLADLDGRLLLPFEGAPVGAVLPPDALSRGQPVVVDGEAVGTALVPADPFQGQDPFGAGSPEAGFLTASARALAWALAGGLAVALGLAWWLSGRTVRPLRDLTSAAQRIATSDPGPAVEVATDDEIGQLAAAFNAMSTRLAEATALRRQLTADVAHDLRTPLSAVLATLEAVRDGALPATPERLAATHAEADRLGRLVGDLHTLALADAHEVPIHPETLDPGEVLRQLALAHEATARRAGIALEVDIGTVSPILADPDRLTQALGNLVQNALRHTPAGGRIRLSARPEQGGVSLAVTDTGEGIPADLLPRVFERSVRADGARGGDGSGLGLPIVRALADAMGGRAGISSPPGQGTTAWIGLPRAPHGAPPGT